MATHVQLPDAQILVLPGDNLDKDNVRDALETMGYVQVRGAAATVQPDGMIVFSRAQGGEKG